MWEIPKKEIEEDLNFVRRFFFIVVLLPLLLCVLVVGVNAYGPIFGPVYTNLHPTYEELNRRGYYAYVIPSSIVEKYDWREEPAIWSWSRHCNPDSHSRDNPLQVKYFDMQDNLIFRIQLSPWSLIEWDPFQPTVQIPFDTKWAEPGTLEMFERPYKDNTKVIYLRYKDWYGTPVYVISTLPLTETLTLIYLLNYEGASLEKAEPWEKCEYW